MNNNSSFSFIKQLARPHLTLCIVAFALAILLAALSPIRPWLLHIIIDENIVSGNKLELLRNSTIFFGLLLGESLISFLFALTSGVFSNRILHELRQKVYSHILNLELAFFDREPIGKLTTRTINDVAALNSVFSDNFFMVLTDALKIVFILVTMLLLDVKLTFLALCCLPILFIATYFFKQKVQAANTMIREKIRELNTFTQERFMGLKVIKAFLAEDREFLKFEKINKEQFLLNKSIIFSYSWFFPILDTLIAVSVGLVVWYIAYSSFNNESMKVGMITTFILYINTLYRPMRHIADRFANIQLGFVAAGKIKEILNTDEKEINKGTIVSKTSTGNVSFENVSFSYNEATPVLKNLSFDIPAKSSLAIVGSTGSGKTTIVSLLSRFYLPQKGTIKIDGENINNYTLASLRNTLSLVLQEVYLFSGTLLENICLDNSNIKKSDIISMAKTLDVHDFFMQLPNDYEFKINNQLNSLSHGQLQIISLFRAIVKNPSILILDEATSSVDSNTEFFIQKLISQVIKEKTTIVIAHRLSTIMQADKILVLDKGEIVGFDTHEALSTSNIYYMKYFEDLKKAEEN